MLVFKLILAYNNEIIMKYWLVHWKTHYICLFKSALNEKGESNISWGESRPSVKYCNTAEVDKTFHIVTPA